MTQPVDWCTPVEVRVQQVGDDSEEEEERGEQQRHRVEDQREVLEKN